MLFHFLIIKVIPFSAFYLNFFSYSTFWWLEYFLFSAFWTGFCYFTFWWRKYFLFQRFPTVFGTDFEAFLYVSVICPTDWDGRPPAGINYFKLKIRRKSRLCLVMQILWHSVHLFQIILRLYIICYNWISDISYENKSLV